MDDLEQMNQLLDTDTSSELHHLSTTPYTTTTTTNYLLQYNNTYIFNETYNTVASSTTISQDVAGHDRVYRTTRLANTNTRGYAPVLFLDS